MCLRINSRTTSKSDYAAIDFSTRSLHKAVYYGGLFAFRQLYHVGLLVPSSGLAARNYTPLVTLNSL